ncbi:hypothetical protein HGG71_02605 [Rhodobacteraceae bacterium R_SAG2]|nr:hypothetical protein [Rhodobacteraceae bacterium R_SAG2]
MKRRQFLAGTATFPALGAAIATASALKDRHAAWFEEWKALREQYAALPSKDAECEDLWNRFEAVERLIVETPATTPQGMAVQIQFAIEDGLVGDAYGGEFQGADLNMFRNIAAALEAA